MKMRHHDAFDPWSVLLSAHELGATVFLWNTRMLVSFRMVPNNVSMPDKTQWTVNQIAQDFIVVSIIEMGPYNSAKTPRKLQL